MKKYYKVKLTTIKESIDQFDSLVKEEEEIIVERVHDSLRDIKTNNIFDILWLEKIDYNTGVNKLSFLNHDKLEKEYIPITSDDIIAFYNNEYSIEDNVSNTYCKNSYHNYYLIENILEKIYDDGYYIMIEPEYFLKNSDRVKKEEVKKYLENDSINLITKPFQKVITHKRS